MKMYTHLHTHTHTNTQKNARAELLGKMAKIFRSVYVPCPLKPEDASLTVTEWCFIPGRARLQCLSTRCRDLTN